MELVIFISLIGLALGFIFTGAISGDRINLIPGSAIIFIVGLLIVSGTPLEIQDGTEYTYKDINGSYEVDTETNVYKEYNPPSPLTKERFSTLLGLVMISISLYYFLISVSNINFRSTMRGKGNS